MATCLPFTFLDHIPQALFGGRLRVYVLLERFGRDGEPGSIMGPGSWERSTACWKCRELITLVMGRTCPAAHGICWSYKNTSEIPGDFHGSLRINM